MNPNSDNIKLNFVLYTYFLLNRCRTAPIFIFKCLSHKKLAFLLMPL
nr:MAG TPA: hypothetical protein [Caudoviricetes sp.]